MLNVRRPAAPAPWIAASALAVLLLAAFPTGPARAADASAPGGAAGPASEAVKAAAPAGPGLQWRLLPSLQAPASLAPRPGAVGNANPAGGSLEAGSGLLAQALVTDYFLTSSGLGPRVTGGFRATGGLLAARQRGSPLANDAALAPSARGTDSSGPLPYVGIGYTGLALGAGWGLQADLGLVAAGGLRLGRPTAPAAAAEDLMRELRLTPVLRVGASYAF